MSKQLLSIVDRLQVVGVPVVIIGEHAVNFHGYLRATEVLNLVFHRDAQCETALYKVLTEFGAYWIGDEINPETGIEKTYPITLDYIRTHPLLMLGTELGYIDLFDFLPGLPNTSLDEFFHAAVVVLSDRPFASLEWLKQLKRVANRPQDQIDLEHLP